MCFLRLQAFVFFVCVFVFSKTVALTFMEQSRSRAWGTKSSEVESIAGFSTTHSTKEGLKFGEYDYYLHPI